MKFDVNNLEHFGSQIAKNNLIFFKVKPILWIQSYGILIFLVVTSQTANKNLRAPNPSYFVYKQANAQPY